MELVDWIETESGNRISKHALIHGSDHILIAGNTTISAKVELHGDKPLVQGSTNAIQLGKFCYLDEGVVISPPLCTGSRHKICKIGSYTMIGRGTIVESANVGNRVVIGPNCKLHKSSTIYDCVVIKPNTIVPENYTIPPFSIVSSSKSPGGVLRVEHLPESYKKVVELNSKLSYINSQFIPSDTP
ncbi:unnamed protein product [Cyberlindnera jadinii]|uniref:Dynactin subunit 5 n=1 Tax=Cyberlindnera jadinii (strain ATCC 18201 / CBS 1600 / BCRC 20928 / JCM 3617 / NBRC 0987 / NRRL Y-1542) TaxID=983966 RepID=A0A0H5C6R2_CYBJN|nr:hypothetical protein CYBJADRAFT_169005 [Cyberlindnera jadinii NRRL Y-1542]ODV71985.1 hypothetical protein CYBJADRAFT_169005 [Cyberlindnera jadinii NRRL Y-1542]CEP23723.1 unnamed protein product [Cyberlindnera jadinii]